MQYKLVKSEESQSLICIVVVVWILPRGHDKNKTQKTRGVLNLRFTRQRTATLCGTNSGS